MSQDHKWGEDPQADCAELQERENAGEYPEGHHDLVCSVHTDAPPVSNILIADAPVTEPTEEI